MTIGDIKADYSKEKRQAEKMEPWVYLVTRPLSFPAAWICMKMGMSATAVTYLSLLFITGGGVLVTLASPAMQITGTIFFTVWLILDCADGNIARYLKTFSSYGEFVDALGGYLINGVIFPVMAVAAVRHNRFGLPDSWLIAAGFLCAQLNLLSRLLYQKQLNLMGEKGQKIKPADNQHSGLLKSAQTLASVSGIMLPFSTLVIIFKIPSLFLFFYLPVNILMFLYTMYKVLKRKD